jgi:two-component system, chemotaxis family, sensor kinase CheA
MSREAERARKDFISEAEELVEALAQGISEIERQRGRVRPSVINDVFRAVHSLKGLAGMLGYGVVAELAHRLEDLLDRLRLGKVAIDDPLVALLQDSAGAVSRHIGWISEGESGPPPDTSPLLGRIDRFGSAAPAAAADELDEIDLDAQSRKSLTEYEEHRLRENVLSGRDIFGISVTYDFAEFDTRLRALTAVLNEMGEVLSTLPSPDASGTGISFRLLCGTEAGEAAIRAAAGEGADIRNLRRRAPELAGEADDEALSIRSVAPTIRVDVTKLDVLMNIVGELFLSRTRLEALVRTLRDTADRSLVAAGERLDRNLGRKLDELQKAVIDLRLVPVSQLYSRLTRVARAASRELGKDVEIVLEGSDTELDKMLVELIADPLMHIVRNAVGHGIETAYIRAQRGKPAAGRVTLRAYPRGSSVILDVIDDGRGIDVETVRQRAVGAGLVGEEQQITVEEAHELLFAAGFSTADEVSEISGRGVGLDVVRRNIQELKGSIEVYSEPGSGSTFRITLPITLAIVNALIVRSGQEQFAIPLTAVEEIVRLDAGSVASVGGQEAVLVRDRTFPLLRLAEAFGTASRRDEGRLYVVIAKAGEREVGIAVEGVERQQEIVIKSVGDRIRRVPGVAGATDIGEDEVVLVLDVGSLVDAFSGGGRRAAVIGA